MDQPRDRIIMKRALLVAVVSLAALMAVAIGNECPVTQLPPTCQNPQFFNKSWKEPPRTSAMVTFKFGDDILTTNQSFQPVPTSRDGPTVTSDLHFKDGALVMLKDVQSDSYTWTARHEFNRNTRASTEDTITFAGKSWLWNFDTGIKDSPVYLTVNTPFGNTSVIMNKCPQTQPSSICLNNISWTETMPDSVTWSFEIQFLGEKSFPCATNDETCDIALVSRLTNSDNSYLINRTLIVGKSEIVSLSIGYCKRSYRTDPIVSVTVCLKCNDSLICKNSTNKTFSEAFRNVSGLLSSDAECRSQNLQMKSATETGSNCLDMLTDMQKYFTSERTLTLAAMYEWNLNESLRWTVAFGTEPAESILQNETNSSAENVCVNKIVCLKIFCRKYKACCLVFLCKLTSALYSRDSAQSFSLQGTVDSKTRPVSTAVDTTLNVNGNSFWSNTTCDFLHVDRTMQVTELSSVGSFEWKYTFSGSADERFGSPEVCLHWGTGEEDLFTSYVAQSYPNPLYLLSTGVGVQKTSSSSDNQLDVRADIKLCGNVRMQCTNNTVSPLSVVCELQETTSTPPSSTVTSSKTESTATPTTEGLTTGLTTVSVPSVPTTSPTTATTTEMSTSPQQTSPNSSSPVSFGDNEAVKSSSPLPIAVGVAVPVVLIIVVAALVVIILRRRRLAGFGSGRRSPRPYDNPGYEFNNSDNTISGVANDVERNDPATGLNNRTNTEASDSSQGALDYYSVIRDSEINPSDAAFRPMESLYKLAKGHHTDTAMTNAGAGKSGAAAGNINEEDDIVPPELPPKKRDYASLEDLSASADHLYSGLSPTYQSGPHAGSQGEGVYHILEPSGATRDAGIDTEEGREGIYHIPKGDAGKSVYHVLDDDPDDIYHTPKSNAAAKPKSPDQNPTEGGVYHILEKEPATSDQAKGAGIYHILEEDPSTTKKTPQHGHNVYHTLEKEEDTSAGGDYFTLEEEYSETHNPDVAKPEDSEYNSLDFDRKGKNVQRCTDDQEEAAVYSHLQSGDEDDYNELERNRKERTIDEDYSHLQQ